MESKRDGREFSKMKGITRTTTYFVIDDSEIPDGVLMEILLRLPLKSIFKFKCVSKRWLSVISDPYLVTSFLAQLKKESLSPAWDLLFCYMYNGGGEISAKDMAPRLTFKNHPDFKPRGFSLEFLTSEVHPQNQSIKVLAASNGLMLMSCPRIVRLYMLYLRAIVYNEIMHWLCLSLYNHSLRSKCEFWSMPLDKLAERLAVSPSRSSWFVPRNAFVISTWMQVVLNDFMGVCVWELRDYDSGEWFMRSKLQPS